MFKKLIHRNTLILMIAFSLIYLFILGINAPRSTNESIPTTQLKSSPEWFAKDISTTIMNNEGHPERIFVAKTLQHYENTQTTDITEPFFSFYSEDQSLWHATAKFGVSHHGKSVSKIDRLDLQDNVEIWREPIHKSKRPVNIYTTELSIFPEKSYAETDKHVLMTQPGHQFEGDGLKTYFDREWVTLLNNVRGQHASLPQKFN